MEEDNKYINLKILGKGNRGEITKKVKSLKDQKIYVLKNIGEQSLSENQTKILKILEKNECPNIVKYYPLIETNNNKYIKTEFINDVDLQDYMNTYIDLGQHIEEKVLWKIFFSCIKSVRYLHKNNIIHRNIRLENFYMTDNKEVKLGNFKYAIFNNDMEGNMIYPEDGLLYKSAEALNNDNYIYNEESDIYALGVVFYKLCYFKFPYEIVYKFDEEKNDNGKFELKKNKQEESNYSDDLKNLITNMLEQQEKDKLKIETIYEEAKKHLHLHNTFESVLRCLSTFGYLSNDEMHRNLKKVRMENNCPIIFNLYMACKYIDEIESENKDNYTNGMKQLRTLFNEYIKIQNDEEPKPIIILNYFMEKYTKEVDFLYANGYLDEGKYNKMKKLFNGIMKINNKSKNEAHKYQFNNIIINLSTLKINKATNKYDIEQKIIGNDFEDELGYKYHYESFPDYLIVLINRGENYNNMTGINYPPEFEITEGYKHKYCLTGFIVRKIEDGKDKYIPIYLKDVNEWWLSEDNKISKFNNANNALEHLNGVIEIIFYKIRRQKAQK